MKSLFKRMKVEIVPLSENISMLAADYVEKYYLSNSVEMADSLIAATCIENGATLITANDKHYRVIDNLDLKVFRP